MTLVPGGAAAARGRTPVLIGAAVLVASSLLQWWQVGGGAGELPPRSDVGISDGRVFLMFLAAAACLLLLALPFAARRSVPIDHPLTYLALLATAAFGYVLRVADLAGQGLGPWPPTRGIGFWLAGLGLALLASGVLWLFRERPRRVEGREAAPADEAAPAEAAPADEAAPAEAAPAEAAARTADEFPDAGLDSDPGPDPDPRPVYVPDWVMRAWHRFAGPSDRPDRSGALDSEPRGRPDRMDLWVVLALIVVILSMRVYRLGEPTQMYFDEVYHARTATEFLQEWRYGIGHDIFESTHPHLAKYAIAGGITLFSDDRVTSTGQLGVPVEAAVIQERTQNSPGPAGAANTAAANTDAGGGDAVYGDRVLIATGSEVRAYDLATRALAHAYSIPAASALSQPAAGGVVYVGTSEGQVYSIDTNSLDDLRAGRTTTVEPAVRLSVATGLSITHIYAGSPPYILVSDAGGDVVSIDLTSPEGKIVGRGMVPGAEDFAALGTGPTVVVADPSRLADANAEAQTLADYLGIDAAPIQETMSSADGLEVALPLGTLTTAQIDDIQSSIAAGDLPGIDVSEPTPEVLVAYRDGVGSLDARHVVVDSTIPTSSPATSIALEPNAIRKDVYRFYVTAGDSLLLLALDTSASPYVVALENDQPLAKMPGRVTQVVFDQATKVASVLGRTPDGTAWTVYAVETNGNAVFSDARLPFEPVAIGIDNATSVAGLDTAGEMPNVDREDLLAFAADGSTASADVGQFAFSWRIVGVLFGTLMAVCLYLLARILFRRRSVGLLVAFFSLVDGMLFAQSRIATNDTYVGGFLLLAYLIFAVIWFRVWKNRFVFWVGMPILGVVLGLALASKWVAFYAIASICVLILIRSALGRLMTILGLAAGTGVLGWMAIAEMSYEPNTGNVPLSILLLAAATVAAGAGLVWVSRTRLVPDKVFAGVAAGFVAAIFLAGALWVSPAAVDNGAPNYTFFVIMLAITCLAAAANAYRPVAWTREEFHFALGAPPVIGLVGPSILALLFVPFGLPFDPALLVRVSLAAGAAGLAVGIAAGATFWIAGRVGFGPLAVAPRPGSAASFADPPSPAPEGWLRLGSGFGIPAAWTGLCIAVLPFLVYIVLYIPWAMPWQPQTAATGPEPAIACWSVDNDTGICLDAWPAGHTGQTLWDLTVAMYDYHNNLRQPHPASSPWWAWPLDLKPVWFDSGGDVPGMFSWIHDGGNPALWWMAITGVAFLSWQAWRRRNLGLALVAVAFFWQWLSWSRIDRAAFQYHFYTALPFFLLALAYFLAELWHGPSRRTWLLGRVAGAFALLLPGFLWLLKPELCGLARVDSTDFFGSTVCGNYKGDVVITTRIFLIAAVLVGALLALSVVVWRLERRRNEGLESRGALPALLGPAAIAAALMVWLGSSAPNDVLMHAALPSDSLTFIPVTLGVLGCYFVLTARDPRRFVVGVCAVSAVVFVFMYPDLSALWLPDKIQGIYAVTSPTWMYGFEFATNLQVSPAVKLVSIESLTAVLAALGLAGLAAWAASERRIEAGWTRAGAAAGGAAAAEAEVAASSSADSAVDDAGADPAADSSADSEDGAGAPYRS